MLEFTIQLARVNSGSYNVAGIKQIAKLLAPALAELNCQVESVDLPPVMEINNAGTTSEHQLGSMLRCYKRLDAPLQVLLVGHMDTVFTVDHSFQDCREVAANKLNGPGVADMKGGIVIMLEALRAFEQLPFANKLGWEVILTPDEEIGSPSTKPILMQAAQRHTLGLVYEPAMDEQGTLAGQRKGSGDFTLVARGKAAHAGRAFAEGRSAIYALAKLIDAINELNQRRPTVTINVGNIQGGGPVNIVPDLCVARLNVRLTDAADETWLAAEFDRLTQVVAKQTGVVITLHGGFHKKPKYITGKTAQLYELVREVGKSLQLTITWQPTGGCCDGNNLSAAGLANVDTMGVRGANIHTSAEFLVIDSLAERARLSTALLAHFAQHGFPS